MTMSIYLRKKPNAIGSTITSEDSMLFYDMAIACGAPHDEAANFQGWVELAGPGEVYDCMSFYAEAE